MSLASDFVLADATPTNRTFAVNATDKSSVSRVDTSTTLPEPRTMRIAHTTEGKSGSTDERARHLLSFEQLKKDATTGKISKLTLNVTVAVPVPGQFSRTEVNHLVKFATNFFATTDNVDRLLRGEG